MVFFPYLCFVIFYGSASNITILKVEAGDAVECGGRVGKLCLCIAVTALQCASNYSACLEERKKVRLFFGKHHHDISNIIDPKLLD